MKIVYGKNLLLILLFISLFVNLLTVVFIFNQNRQVGHLISTSRELFNLQKSINLADSDAYNIVTDCTFNEINCDQKAGAEKLKNLKEGRDLMTAQIDKLSQEIETTIKNNHW